MQDSARQTELDRIRADMAQPANATPAALRRNVEDRPEKLRRDIWALYWSEAKASANPSLRSAVVRLMLEALPDESPMLQGQIARWLQDFEARDFSTEARELLLKLSWSADYAPQLIRLVGIARMAEARPGLEREVREDSLMTDAGPDYHGKVWAALLALARSGDDAALERVIRQVKQESDIIVRATVLFPDLAYTLRRPAFEVLAAYMESVERLPQLKATVPGRPEAAYAAAAFAQGVRDFPFRHGDLTEEQVMQAREWIRSHKWELK